MLTTDEHHQSISRNCFAIRPKMNNFNTFDICTDDVSMTKTQNMQRTQIIKFSEMSVYMLNII